MHIFRRSCILLFLGLGGWVSAGQDSLDFGYAENIRFIHRSTEPSTDNGPASPDDRQTAGSQDGVLLEIEAPDGSSEPLHYYLAEKPIPPAELPEGTRFIPVPAERIVSLSTTYLGALGALDQLDRVVAVDDAAHATDPRFRKRVESGEVSEVGTPERLDLESVLAAKPDLVLLTRVGPGRPDLENRLARAGIPVLVTSAWRENTPLGRAEWIKLFGLLTGSSEEAVAIFEEVSENYEDLREIGRQPGPDRPTVLLSAPYGGVWYIPGGRSYSAAFIEDAGASYLWADNRETGSFPLDFEAVFSRAMQADFWLNPSSYRTLEAIAAADERFEVLPAYRTGNVFNRTRRSGGEGGNAFWESGAIRPDQILADLIAILHPDRMPDHEFIFYEKLR